VSGIPHSATEPYPLPNPYIMLKPTLSPLEATLWVGVRVLNK